jgi:hypothetical protein
MIGQESLQNGHQDGVFEEGVLAVGDLVLEALGGSSNDHLVVVVLVVGE